MNDSFPTPQSEIYSVFEFALATLPNGMPRQSVQNIGEFDSIEEAFAAALARARSEAVLLAGVFAALPGVESGDPLVGIFATEWGYDIRHEQQTITRLWIHSHSGGDE